MTSTRVKALLDDLSPAPWETTTLADLVGTDLSPES